MTTFDVPLVPQQTAKSCWAASVTMLLSWAQQSSIDPAALTDIPGFQRAYEVKGLDLKTARTTLATWGLVTEPPQDYSAQGFADLLDSYGPLFVAAYVKIGDSFANHSRVITGFDQDNDTVYISTIHGAPTCRASSRPIRGRNTRSLTKRSLSKWIPLRAGSTLVRRRTIPPTSWAILRLSRTCRLDHQISDLLWRDWGRSVIGYLSVCMP
jgi:hypothetical protein